MTYLRKICLIILSSFLLIINNSCENRSRNELIYNLPDTLKIGTLYSPTSFFIFRGDTLGYEYERIHNFIVDKKLNYQFHIARNMTEMIEMLDSGKIDIIAYEVPIINEYKNKLINCGTETITTQVLVQPKSNSMITDVTQLIGKDIYVEQNSKYEIRLKNLDNEVGGGINIHSITQDSIITEDLIKMVANKQIPLTIVDSDIAKLNQTYYKNIDISLPISFEQRASWAVNKSNTQLADSINSWAKTSKTLTDNKRLLKRYFELSKNSDIETELPKFKFINGIISPYDNIFKKYAKEINWDWKLLAAQAWSESHFDTTAVSWAGARGLMQLMPSTARAYGLELEHIENPELNVKAAVANIKDLDEIFSKRVTDPAERIKFIIAAYNSGAGHILDAIALAEKYGKNPQKWENNVSVTLQWKSNPEYFNDVVCRNGYFRGSQTITYVKKVENCFNYFSSNIK
ncbi:MAG: transporter substrate-binding domain-containing protein [Bacteroidales bacterium]|nr:transporter substrate-binding domain-containing protein [Bacteroidales bacterium]